MTTRITDERDGTRAVRQVEGKPGRDGSPQLLGLLAARREIVDLNRR
jgi:hypothetical protein